MTLGQRIKEARERKGLTSEELAKRLGVSQANVSQMENDARKPDVDKIIALSSILEMSSDDLLGIKLRVVLPEQIPKEFKDIIKDKPITFSVIKESKLSDEQIAESIKFADHITKIRA